MSVTAITQDFQVSTPDHMQNFFWKKNDIAAQIQATITRITHLVRTGIWIDANTVCHWAEKHPEHKLSNILASTRVHRKVIRSENQMAIPKKTLWEKISDIFAFITEFIKHPTTVGAILPSSHKLAKEIVSQIPKDLKAEARTICEIGPGDGVFTDEIIKRMNKDDKLVLVEYDTAFCSKLEKRYKTLI